MNKDIVYVIWWTFGQHSDTTTHMLGFTLRQEDAKSFIKQAQVILDKLVKLDVSCDLPWGVYHDYTDPTREDWARAEEEVGVEAVELVAELLEMDRSWLGYLHALSENYEPVYAISEIPRVARMLEKAADLVSDSDASVSEAVQAQAWRLSKRR